MVIAVTNSLNMKGFHPCWQGSVGSCRWWDIKMTSAFRQQHGTDAPCSYLDISKFCGSQNPPVLHRQKWHEDMKQQEATENWARRKLSSHDAIPWMLQSVPSAALDLISDCKDAPGNYCYSTCWQCWVPKSVSAKNVFIELAWPSIRDLPCAITVTFGFVSQSCSITFWPWNYWNVTWLCHQEE